MVNPMSSVHHIEKLHGAQNYGTWKADMKACLNRDGAWKVVCGREVKAATATAASAPTSDDHHTSQFVKSLQNPIIKSSVPSITELPIASSSPGGNSRKPTVIEDHVFDERNEMAYDTIILGVEKNQQVHIKGCRDDGKTAWEIFEKLYEDHGMRNRFFLRRQLYKNSTMEAGEKIESYINRKMTIAEKLHEIGVSMQDGELADLLLMDVTEDYHNTATTIAQRESYTVDDVTNGLIREELERRMRALNTNNNQSRNNSHPEAQAPKNHKVPIARQLNRSIKRPHEDNIEEPAVPNINSTVNTVNPAPNNSASPTTPSTGKRKPEEQFKKPKTSIKNGGRKPKIQPIRDPRGPPQPLDRPFQCLFSFAGCNQTFGSKNEWKRHINHIHLQLWFWRCDFPSCANRKAFFNRKDLFGQHLKRMHGPSPPSSTSSTPNPPDDMTEIQERCKKERRKPPERSVCGFCKKVSEGPSSWEAHVDHVGEHYSQGKKFEQWQQDKGFVEWAFREGIVPSAGQISPTGGTAQVATLTNPPQFQPPSSPTTQILANKNENAKAVSAPGAVALKNGDG